MALSFNKAAGGAKKSSITSYSYRDGDNEVRLVGDVLARYVYWLEGKNGKNIEALIKRVSARTDPSDWVVRAPDPEFTLTPGEDGETIVVDVCRSSLSTWTLNHVGAALDCMHC